VKTPSSSKIQKSLSKNPKPNPKNAKVSKWKNRKALDSRGSHAVVGHDLQHTHEEQRGNPKTKIKNQNKCRKTKLKSEKSKIKISVEKQKSLVPIPLIKTPRIPSQLSQVLDRNHLVQFLAKLVTPGFLPYRKYVIYVYHYSHHNTYVGIRDCFDVRMNLITAVRSADLYWRV